jgi:hypothetical protein
MEETAPGNGPVCTMNILQQDLIKVVEKHNLKIRQINISFSTNTGCTGSLSFRMPDKCQDNASGGDDSFSGDDASVYGKSRRNRRVRRKLERAAKSKSPTTSEDGTSGYSSEEYSKTKEDKKDDLKESYEKLENILVIEWDALEKEKHEDDLIIEKDAFKNEKDDKQVNERREVIGNINSAIGISDVQTNGHSDIPGLDNKVSTLLKMTKGKPMLM